MLKIWVNLWYNTIVKNEQIQDNLKVWQTFGQEGAKRLLDNFLQNEKLDAMPHAFLFLGPEGVGKNLLAKEFAQKIDRTAKLAHSFKSNATVNSDILEYDFSESGNVESLRELIGFSSLSSFGAGSRKIFLIKNFHLATTASSNIMLKTLEEPSGNSIFLLVANSNKVLPTVMSRCIAVRCFPVKSMSDDSQLPQNLSIVLSQFPTLIEKLQSSSEQSQKLGELLGKLQNHDLNLINLNTLVDLEINDLKLLIKVWIYFLKDQLVSGLSSSNMANVVNNLKVAQNTDLDLNRNYNTKLVLQQFLIQTKW